MRCPLSFARDGVNTIGNDPPSEAPVALDEPHLRHERREALDSRAGAAGRDAFQHLPDEEQEDHGRIDASAQQIASAAAHPAVTYAVAPPERRHVEDGYRSLPFPFPEIEAPSLDITVVWKLPDLFGYVDTWSAVRAAEKAVGRAEIDAFHAELSEAWGDPDAIKRVSWPLSLRIGRVS
ncbi:hypothetical protein [Enterovirga sp.]|uniref:hypothetical protein n=1 Tax=Enterovirga sp. TaxID=2026350 RepID=UPI002CB33EB9|nr:hypothetical protein [Enterovirga sp.]HMO31107.1 hypothetical protein [Enterovirga sp.]